MKALPLLAAVCVGLECVGCRTPNPNPPTADALTGYVDFYTDADLQLSWSIKRGAEQSGEMRSVYSELEPPAGNVLRLPTRPGAYTFEVWFLNRATTGGQSVRVQVVSGMVTPVHVSLSQVGTTLIDKKDYSFRGSTKGYARGTKISSQAHDLYRIDAQAGQSQTYLPKEQMTYFRLEPK